MRVRQICGHQYCTVLHGHAEHCDGRPRLSLSINYLPSSLRTTNQAVVRSNPARRAN